MKKRRSRLTKAVTHISLEHANRDKLARLDDVWAQYRPLCEQYVHYFCTACPPDAHHPLMLETPLSDRWHRVAIQQAAGIAKSWLSNRQNHYEEYLSRQAYHESLSIEAQAKRKAPQWHEPRLPTLRQVCIQANVNVSELIDDDTGVIALQQSESGMFDGWLWVATLVKRKPVLLPIKLSDYHRKVLAGQSVNTSTQLNKHKGKWTLTLSYDQKIDTPKRTDDTPIVAVDVGISNFITTSTGRQYGTFKDDLAAAHQRDRLKRQRKAKLRACLQKKGVSKLPSTSSATGQRLARRVKQDINRAVNQLFADHPGHHIVMEKLNVGEMRFKAKRMNAYLYASNLGHIPDQIAWRAATQGVTLTQVPSAYSSQECSTCHFTHRDNRPNQQTFCCQGCGLRLHADTNASLNLLNRLDDEEMHECKGLDTVKNLLDRRHRAWLQTHKNGCP
jgi:IS605 OrfB family transposase